MVEHLLPNFQKISKKTVKLQTMYIDVFNYSYVNMYYWYNFVITYIIL